MKISRRSFIGGLVSVGALPIIGCSQARQQTLLTSSATDFNGQHWMMGLDDQLLPTFKLPLPSRGHGVIYSKKRDQALAFARRPGEYVMVVDGKNAKVVHHIVNPPNRRFYGHGVFNADESLLLVAENDYEQAKGKIGVYDPLNGYRKIDEWDAGGTGTHEIRLSHDQKYLVVANGGIHTHPLTPRAKLNVEHMKPNLAFIELSTGKVARTFTLPDAQSSIRHIGCHANGVAVGLQHQTHTSQQQSLTAWCDNSTLGWLDGTTKVSPLLKHYIASVAVSSDGLIGYTAPRGNKVLFVDALSGELKSSLYLGDPGGIAFNELKQQFVVSTGAGGVYLIDAQGLRIVGGKEFEGIRWDNHMMLA